MLKYSIIIALTCLFKAVYSIPANTFENLKDLIPLVNGKATYTETVDCGSITQAELFRRSRIWLSHSNPEMVIQIADKETGDLAGRGNMAVTVPRTESSAGGIYSFRYSLTIECVNRKYRTTISHIEVLDASNARTIPFEKFNLKSATEQETLHAGLDLKFKELLQDLQSEVKDYKPF